MSEVEHTTGLLLPTDPEARKKIRSECQEISNSMTRIEGYKEQIKNAVDAISKEHELPKADINKIVAIYHKQNKDEAFGKMEDVQALYETIFELSEED